MPLSLCPRQMDTTGDLVEAQVLKIRNGSKTKLAKTLKSLLSVKEKKEQVKAETTGNRFKNENDNNLCRVCLRDGTIFIFGNKIADEDLAGALCSFGGIEVSIDDSYPKYLCQSCHESLKTAILFRQTAQQSDQQLKTSEEKVPDTDPFDNFLIFVEDNVTFGPVEIEEKKDKIRKFLTCNPCNIQFNSYQDLSDHRKSHARLRLVPNSCHQCNIQFNSQEEYSDHKKTFVHGNKDYKYTCDLCKIKFQSREAYHNHKKTLQHTSKAWKCPICENFFHPRVSQKHLSYHKEGASVCDVCGKSFSEHTHLINHLVTHSKKLPYKCSICPYKGRRKDDFTIHMRSHTGERPYQCIQCLQRFTTQSNLSKHKTIHNVERDFKCTQCGHSYQSKDGLNSHVKNAHVSVVDHVCQYCDKLYNSRREMLRHQRRNHKRPRLPCGVMPAYLKIQQENNKESDSTGKQ